MAGCPTAWALDVGRWAKTMAKQAAFGDRRLRKRFVSILEGMASNPAASLPQQTGTWSDLIGAYRFLHNPKVTPAHLLTPHVRQTVQRCGEHRTVLYAVDHSELKPTCALSKKKTLQHAALALSEQGQALGLLRMTFIDDLKGKRTHKQRREGDCRSKLWSQTVTEVARLGLSSRMIALMDREGDDFGVFLACRQVGHGFVIRAQHDRHLIGGDTLWPHVESQPAQGGLMLWVPSRPAVTSGPPRRQHGAQSGRWAKLEVRWAQVTLKPPANDPRYKNPVTLWAVQAKEIDPPPDAQPVEWMLLTDEPVRCLGDAILIIGRYQKRWLIEELHKGQKTGCRLEDSQLQEQEAFERLATIVAVIAVRLLELRDLAGHLWAEPLWKADAPMVKDTPKYLRQIVDPPWIQVVAHLARVKDNLLKPSQFFRTLAMKGGWLGRKHDGRPGWQTLWRGWTEVARLVEGVMIAREMERRSCV